MSFLWSRNWELQLYKNQNPLKVLSIILLKLNLVSHHSWKWGVDTSEEHFSVNTSNKNITGGFNKGKKPNYYHWSFLDVKQKTFFNFSIVDWMILWDIHKFWCRSHFLNIDLNPLITEKLLSRLHSATDNFHSIPESTKKMKKQLNWSQLFLNMFKFWKDSYDSKH